MQTAKSEIKEAKKSVKQLKKTWNSIYADLDADTDWEGDNRSDIGGCMMSDIPSDLSTYYDNIDAVLDEICDEIYALKTDLENSSSLLESLVNKVYWVENEIEKTFN